MIGKSSALFLASLVLYGCGGGYDVIHLSPRTVQAGTGSTIYRIGQSVVGSATELLINPKYDGDQVFHDPKYINEFKGGWFKILELEAWYASWTLERKLRTAAERTQMLPLTYYLLVSNLSLWKSVLGNTQDDSYFNA